MQGRRYGHWRVLTIALTLRRASDDNVQGLVGPAQLNFHGPNLTSLMDELTKSNSMSVKKKCILTFVKAADFMLIAAPSECVNSSFSI